MHTKNIIFMALKKTVVKKLLKILWFIKQSTKIKLVKEIVDYKKLNKGC